LMLDLTSGAEPASRYPSMRPPGSFVAAANAVPAPLRICMALCAPGGGTPMDEIGAAVEQAAMALRRAGHHVSDFRYPASAVIGEPAAIIWMTATAEEIDFYRGRVGRDPQASE